MYWSAGILLLSGIMVAACGPTSSPSPTLSEATRSSSPSAITSLAPSATSTATPVPTLVPTPTPTSSPIAGGWPYIGGISEPVFGPDGTVYFLAGLLDGQDEYQHSLVALDPTGYVKPGWPIAEPPGSDFGSLAVAPDESVYVGECGGQEIACVLHRLGTDGREFPGWPSQLPPSFACPAGGYCFNGVQFGPDGTAYLTGWRAIGGLQVIAIDPSGEIVSGWPVALDAQGVWWSDAQVGSDGTLFILRGPDGSESPVVLAAFASDGSPRSGWPASVPDIGGYLLGPQGTVIVWSRIDNTGELCLEPRRTVFTVLGANGRTLPGWPRGSKGYASSPVVDADGAIYYVSELRNVYAHDRAGEIKAGWPVAVPEAIGHLCGPESPALAPDGTIYVLAHDYRLNTIEITARSPDGRSRPGWPYRSAGQLIGPPFDSEGGGTSSDPVFGPDGPVYLVVFQTDATGVWAEVVALDRQGQLMPGWPYRLPIDPTAGDVASLTVSPDGRLFVRGGYDSASYSWLLALDPDGRVSE